MAATKKRSDNRVSKIESTRRNKFALEYAVNGGNATQAYITAGYSEKSARQCASRLLTNANVLEEIKRYKQTMHDRLMMSYEETLQEAAQLAGFDPIRLRDENGALRDIADMDEATRKSIQEITMNGEQIMSVKVGRDKAKALDMLMKFYNAYEAHRESGANRDITIYMTHPLDAKL